LARLGIDIRYFAPKRTRIQRVDVAPAKHLSRPNRSQCGTTRSQKSACHTLFCSKT
jgi:hypothetical protein